MSDLNKTPETQPEKTQNNLPETNTTNPSVSTPTNATGTTQQPTQSTGDKKEEPKQKVYIRTPTQKRGSKIWPKAFALGCVIFIVLLVALIFAGVYYAIQNPTSLVTIGIGPAQAKSILMIIAGAFFGILFFGSFAFLGISSYRLVKAKNVPKGKYIIWIFISFILLSISLGLGVVVLTNISKINTNYYSRNLVVWYLTVYPKWSIVSKVEEIENPNITSIAPLNVSMKINDTFRQVLSSKLGTNNANSLTLSCGNGDWNKPSAQVWGNNILSDDSTEKSAWFDDPCLYMRKGTYYLEAIYTYFDKPSQQIKSGKIPVGSITIRWEIIITKNGIWLKTNENNTEVMAWDTPARLIFDAKKIFTDFGFRNNEIAWDLNGDGTDEPEKNNKAFFSYNYTQPWLLYVRYRLPENTKYSLYYYLFPLRLLENNVPICTISQKAGSNWAITFQWTRAEGSNEINKMNFEVYNLTKEETIQTFPSSNASLTYTPPNGDQYIIRLVFTTMEWKQWFCESDTINENKATYDIQATLQWKKPQDIQYNKITSTSSDVFIKNDTITSTLAPIDIQIAIDKIVPSMPENATITAVLNNQTINAIKSNIFIGRAYWPKQQQMKVIIDDRKGNLSEKIWTISFNQSPLRGSLLAEPVTWIEPLVVTFDASTISTTDTQDQIIYYTWDFDDGNISKNISYSKMEHTYHFSMNKAQIVYNPSVTILTKKWITQKFTLSTPIAVQRKASVVNITIPSHPTQIATVTQPVTFKMDTDWYVKSIVWDFGDGSSTKECDFRACEETTHIFTSPGTYSVKVDVTYDGMPSTRGAINIKVE